MKLTPSNEALKALLRIRFRNYAYNTRGAIVSFGVETISALKGAIAISQAAMNKNELLDKVCF